MRVISGTAKGRKLKRVPGDTTRPVMDRVKENLFNLLGPHYVPGTRWLDLFAGTGSIGIEALSRGAEHVTFLDTARPAIRTIHHNLRHTRLTDNATVLHTDAFAYLHSNTTKFDLIYIAPPQYQQLWQKALHQLDTQSHLTEDGLIVVQIDPKEYQDLSLNTLTLTDQRRYGNTTLIFYEPLATNDQPHS